MPDSVKYLTVSQLNEYVKMLVDGNPVLSNVWVRGEISNLIFHSSGHLYFSVKDDKARISAVMFKRDAIRLKFRPENGMKILIHGRLSVFERDGVYQIYASSINPDGIGALYIAYEQLKARLEEEGLFDMKLKKALPKLPSSVGIITSPTGAAVRDIINVCGRRFPLAELIIYPSLVQGEGAEKNLIEGIEFFSSTKSADLIIIGRGGGSIEDLWAFNSEALARAIRASNIPVISAVGHETDFTICDFVSDLRAPTPSAAAEMSVPDSFDIKIKLGNVASRMGVLLLRRIQHSKEKLEYLSQRRVLNNPKAYCDDRRMCLLKSSKDFENTVKGIIKDKRGKFSILTATLEAISPLKIISKGYSAVFGKDGKLIKSVNAVQIGDELSVKTTDGTVKATANEIMID